MLETIVTQEAQRELELAEQQAAELWRQAEQIDEAYRAIKARADELRTRLGALEK